MNSIAIINRIEQWSARPIENRPALAQYLASGRPITLFNWECPPRFINRTADGRQFVNYLVNLDGIFAGRSIDEFTEFPRVVSDRDHEIAALSWMRKLGVSYRFVKVVADTNAWYLTPDSLEILGQQTVVAQFREFGARITTALNGYPGAPRTEQFSDLMAPYQPLYDQSYQLALAELQADPSRLVPMAIWEAQLVRTRHHMGMADEATVRDFSNKTIASYAAEGLVLDALSRTPEFGQCVWLNNHEVDDRTIAITNCLREREGIAPLPMIFPAA